MPFPANTQNRDVTNGKYSSGSTPLSAPRLWVVRQKRSFNLLAGEWQKGPAEDPKILSAHKLKIPLTNIFSSQTRFLKLTYFDTFVTA